MNRFRMTMSLIASVTAASLLAAACGVTTSNSVANGQTGNGSSNAASASQAPMAASTKPAFPITLTDDAGTKVTVDKQPMHIVSGTEGTDEIVASLVPKSRIALVTNLSSNPEFSDAAALVKGIPQWTGDDPEKALSVHPDLVLIASYAPAKVITQVRDAGVPVYEFNDFTSVTSIEHNIGVVGELVGERAKASAIVRNMNQNIHRIETAVAKQKRPTVLDYSSYGYAAGKETTVNDVIRMAGGTNVAANLNGWAKITDEEIVKMNPDVIIDSSDDAAFAKKLESDPGLQSVSAIKNHRVYLINSADLSSVSQYVVKAVYDVAKVIHPNVSIPKVQVMQ
ncbi:ABC transporter substrate-binding protein [Alicyclobacillus acidiphilus]|uniref:ABC transporter substrate-binding protein n=1 Tax=Alicyclobacillus acidiphilus TaxID=182455 RepID=UPI0008379539|nr:ABC transporter substrate-binding protein [Alicyclobacillus acidiphilus]